MRVIAGTKKRLPLKTVPGMCTRPTTDRIKETLFNMISNELYDASFLDLYAGSGQMGIEALSRGAKEVYFIEKDKRALQCIRDNLLFTKLSEQAKVLSGDVLLTLHTFADDVEFHIIFMDPPYQAQCEEEVLKLISEKKLLTNDGCVIIEADRKRDFSFVEEIGFSIFKEKEYKTNKHVFLEKKQ